MTPIDRTATPSEDPETPIPGATSAVVSPNAHEAARGPRALPNPSVVTGPSPTAERATSGPRLPRWMTVMTVGTGALCGLSIVVLGAIGQTDAAVAAGSIGAAAFAALGGVSVTINIRGK